MVFFVVISHQSHQHKEKRNVRIKCCVEHACENYRRNLYKKTNKMKNEENTKAKSKNIYVYINNVSNNIIMWLPFTIIWITNMTILTIII